MRFPKSIAINDLNKAIDIDPEYKVAYYNRGVTKYELKDLKGACEDWKKAAELGDEDAAELLKEHCEWVNLKLLLNI